jgi:VIT1/CCC1 family predicted Fe2+/Mn2+ transporter
MVHDALGAHTRDELGISEMTAARPVQAALASAAAFSAGAAPPLLIALAAPTGFETIAVSAASLAFLVVLGAVGAKAGGAKMMKAAIRVAFWGALAMAVTAGVGAIFGAHV